jgi:rhodanese-related sulfurtransferase
VRRVALAARIGAVRWTWIRRSQGAVVEADRFVPIDLCGPHEYQICNVGQARPIPPGDLPKRVHELDSTDEIVARCKSGMRNAKAIDFLRKAGFAKCAT